MADDRDGRIASEGDAALGDLLARGSSDAREPHPSDETWERLAMGELPEAEARAVLEHVRDCSSCLRIHRALGLLEAEAHAFDVGAPASGILASAAQTRRGILVPWPGAGARAWRAAAIAAGLLVAALLYPAYLGLVRLPTVRTGIPTAGPFAGGVRAPVRLAALRGPQGSRVPEIRGGGGEVVLLVEPALGSNLRGEERIRFEIVGSEGVARWSGDVAVAEASAALASPAEAVALVVPASALPPGSYSLRGRVAEGGPVLDLPFVVVPDTGSRQSPEETNAPQ